MRRPYLIAAACLLAVALAADYAYWRVVTDGLRRDFVLWQAALGAKGWHIACGPVVAGGWPLAARLTIPNPTLRHPGSMPVDVAAPSVAVTVPLWRPAALRLPLASPVHLRAEGLPDMILSAEGMVLRAPLNQGRQPAVTFRAAQLRLEPADGRWHGAVTDVSLTVAAGPGDAVGFRLGAQAITLPATRKWPLGQTVGRLSAQGTLSGLPGPAASPAQWATAWRDGGGLLEIARYALAWGPLDLGGSAQIRLDGALQPKGRATAHVAGYAAALDRLAAAGVIAPSAATAARALLSLTAGAAAGTAPDAIDVPLVLQSRTLSIMQVPLIRLPELDWPAPQ